MWDLPYLTTNCYYLSFNSCSPLPHTRKHSKGRRMEFQREKLSTKHFLWLSDYSFSFMVVILLPGHSPAMRETQVHIPSPYQAQRGSECGPPPSQVSVLTTDLKGIQDTTSSTMWGLRCYPTFFWLKAFGKFINSFGLARTAFFQWINWTILPTLGRIWLSVHYTNSQ